jgi:hypothetical protein
LDRCECLAVSKAFLSDTPWALGRDGDPSPSMSNHSTIGEQHGRLRVTVPTMTYARNRLVRTFSW